MERWLPVVGFEEVYKVSSVGRIRRVSTGRILRSWLTRLGYVTIDLCNMGRVSKLVHCLVAEAFICPRPEGLEVNHKNRIRDDNHVENLEWITHTENVPRGEDRNIKLKEEDVHRIRELLLVGASQYKIADVFGVGQQMISNIKLGKSWAWLGVR